jgi:hypothetical protein
VTDTIKWADEMGQQILEQCYTAELLDWAHHAYLYDHDDIEILTLAYCGAENVPGPAKNLLYDIMHGTRKPNKKKAVKISYDLNHAWSSGLNLIGLRRVHAYLRSNLADTSDELGVEAQDIVSTLSKVSEVRFDVACESIGVGKSAMKNILSDIESRLQKLPVL